MGTLPPYEQMLKEAYAKLPTTIAETARFTCPMAAGHIQGNKTVVTNFAEMSQTFNRPQDQLCKYLQRELATPASIDGPRLVLGRKLSSTLINEKIQQYCKDFVLCKVCKKPDTQIQKEDRLLFLKCTACGAREPIKAKIG